MIYQEFCLKQLINNPTRFTSNSFTIIYLILINFPETVSQQGIIDVGQLDHQLIYCTRKIQKTSEQKQAFFRLIKNFSADIFEEALGKLDLHSDNEQCSDINKASSDFIQKITTVTNNIAANKTKKVKSISKEWFDGEVFETIALQDKAFKQFKGSKLHVHKENFKKARYEVNELIAKKNLFETKLAENNGKPKGLRESLKSLGLQNKSSVIISFKENSKLKYGAKSISGVFHNCFSSLTNSVPKTLPYTTNRFNFESKKEFHKNFTMSSNFELTHATENEILDIMNNIEVSKAAGIDKFSGRFLNDNAKVLAEPKPLM